MQLGLLTSRGHRLVIAIAAASTVLFTANRSSVSATVNESLNALPSTIWNSVYTETQAGRGQKVYERACIYCHLQDLKGGSEAAAPPLVGTVFRSRWQNRPLAELFVYMAESMPMDGDAFGGPSPPPRVELEEYVDIIAYVLMANGAPSGDTELPADERLGQILITEEGAGR